MNQTVTICVLGDICPAWGFPKQNASPTAESVFHDVLPLLHSADYCVANLESPTTEHTKRLEKNSVCLKAKPSAMKVLQEAGISALALANNHILDYEETGLSDTLRLAEELNLPVYGAGTLQQAGLPHLVKRNGLRIAFLAFAEQEFNCAEENRIGANRWDDLDSPDLIRQVKQNCDYLIVQYHGGIEHDIYPSPWLQRRCRKMAECGADFVTCQHSHCIGTREQWKGKEILYGQGNSIFGPSASDARWNTGLVAVLTFSDGLKVEYVPIEARVDGEYRMAQEDAQKILQDFEQESRKIQDADFIYKEWSKFCQKQSASYLPLLFGWNRYFNKLNRMTNGKLVQRLTNRMARMNSMNLIRCAAHREVLTTIFEDEYQ